MTDKQTLLDLADRVEAVKPSERVDAAIVAALNNAIVKKYPPSTDFGPSARWQFWSKDGEHFLGNESKYPILSYTTSLDAAQALHDAVLGSDWEWGFINPRICKLRGPDVFDINHHWRGQCDNSAAAWVAAILRAKASHSPS